MLRFPILAVLFVIVFQIGSNASEQKSDSFRVVGYLPEYRMGTLHKWWEQSLTDLIYFSIEPKSTGTLDTSRLNEEALTKLREFSERSQVRILICVGGWGRSQHFASVTVDKASRSRFISNLKAFCKKHGFAGIDYDWEFPKGKLQKQGYEDLLIETKDAFRSDGLLVTVAVGHHQQLSPSAYKAVDYVHLMSYDSGQKHSTYDSSLADIERQFGFGVPREKLILGVPFYGRNMKDTNQAKTYSNIMKSFNPPANLDEAGGFYFNGVHTIQAKTRHAIKENLSGVMIWELGQDSFDDTSLLKAIQRTLADEL